MLGTGPLRSPRSCPPPRSWTTTSAGPDAEDLPLSGGHRAHDVNILTLVKERRLGGYNGYRGCSGNACQTA